VFVVIGTIYIALTGNAIEITSTETLYAGFTPSNVLLILALGLEYFVFDSLGATLRGSYIYAMARNALNGQLPGRNDKKFYKLELSLTVLACLALLGAVLSHLLSPKVDRA